MGNKAAFYVESECEGTAVVIFAKSNAQARRQGADELGADWDGVTCKRDKSYDCAEGHVTQEELWDRGWWFECDECGQRANHDSGGAFRGGHPYCELHADPYAWVPIRDPNWHQTPYVWYRP